MVIKRRLKQKDCQSVLHLEQILDPVVAAMGSGALGPDRSIVQGTVIRHDLEMVAAFNEVRIWLRQFTLWCRRLT